MRRLLAALAALLVMAPPVLAEPTSGLMGSTLTQLETVSATLERQLGPRHPMTLRSWGLVASFLEIEGDLAGAERLYRRILEARLASLGPAHLDTADAQAALAGLRSKQGRFAEAQILISRALATRERHLGAAAAASLEARLELATLLSRQGLWQPAETLMRQVLQARRRQLGERHPQTLLVLNNLGMLMERQSRWHEAEALYRQALNGFGEVWGTDDLVATLLSDNLARALMVRGRLAEAEALQRRALAGRQRLLGPRSPRLATAMANLAETLTVQGRPAEATPLLTQGLQLLEQVVGPDHPETTTLRQNLAVNRWLQQRPAAALALLSQAQDAETLQLQRELPLQPVAERAALLSSVGWAWLAGLSLAAQHPTDPAAVDLALRARLNRHGLLQSLERQQNLVASQGIATRDRVRQLAHVQTLLADLALDPGRRQQLQAQRQELERRLYRSLPQLQPRLISPATVAAALPADGVLVELQRYDGFDPAKPPGSRWGAPRLMALVLPALASGQSPALLPLGEAEPLERATSAALAATLRGRPDAERQWTDLAQRFWAPLRPALQGSGPVFLTLDGDLHQIPLAMLQEGLGQRPLQLLTTGRDLLPEQVSPVPGEPVVMADPLFGRGAPAAADRGPRGGLRGLGPWSRLPGTLQEGRQIAADLGTPLIHGRAATVERLAAVQQPRLLHVATHGYFLPEPPARALKPSLDPLLRSGLVLAPAGDDGYLTAAEVSHMRLGGTQLVTLSACETGRGVRRLGEAVYGLQRALRVAGAQATLLSLWRVDDRATQVLMERFYGRLQRGQAPSTALKQVQQQFRQDPALRARGWQHPFYWAAWQLVGQDAGSRPASP